MFRRRNSQKPSEDFYSDFKANFARLGPRTTLPISEPTPAQSCNTMNTAFDTAFESSHFEGQDDLRNHGATPRDHSADFKSLFEYYSAQDDGYWAPPTPNGSIPYNNQIISTSMGTPISRSTSGSEVAPFDCGTFIMQDFERSHPHQFQNIELSSHQQALQSHHCPSQLTGYGSSLPPQQSVDQGLMEMDFLGHDSGSSYPFDTGAFDEAKAAATLVTASDRFRFRVTLNAPTAMVKHEDEIPVTYLNKCQTYSISIKDTMFDSDLPCQYRTSVRVCFEDQQQRSKPDSCWELWRDTRGKKEAHQRGGRLQAVEYVYPNQGHVDDIGSNVELAAEPPTDGFCVLWTPNQPGTAECIVSVRFNFLSTDFSHSKGVKGIPLRLCAKTEIVGTMPGMSSSASLGRSEACYCTVKLFRDHGAERKLSNDVSHVKKMVEKLKQQIVQQDGGVKDNGKRRRSDSTNRASANTRPTKIFKHKRSWSVSSASSEADDGSSQTDLRTKVAVYQAMYTSTKPISNLFLKGEEQDDPDLHPVRLGPSTQGVLLLDTTGLDRQDTLRTNTSSAVSPVPSSVSIHSPYRRSADLHNSTISNPPSRLPSHEWTLDTMGMPKTDVLSSNAQHLASPPEGPTKIKKLQQDHNMDTKEWIEALDVDDDYQPPPEPVVKPIACFYVRTSIIGKRAGDDYYRAVYLQNRSLESFVKAVTAKYNIDSATIDKTIRILDNGLQVKVDDDVVREIPEGQDILTELYVKSQHAASRTNHDVHEKVGGGTNTGQSAGFLLTIRY